MVCVPAGPVGKIGVGLETTGSTNTASSGEAPTEWNSGWETVAAAPTSEGDLEASFNASAGEWGFLGMSLSAVEKKKKKSKKKKKKKQKLKFQMTQANAETILGGGLDSSEAARAKRAARFAKSANLPPPKKKCIAWSDGKVTSNKTAALLKFLSRKTKSAGSNGDQVKTRPDSINPRAVAVALRLAAKRAMVKRDPPPS